MSLKIIALALMVSALIGTVCCPYVEVRILFCFLLAAMVAMYKVEYL